MFQVKLNKTAKNDLVRIWKFIAQESCNQQIADTFIQDIKNYIEKSLSSFPFSHPKYDLYKKQSLHKLVYKKPLLFIIVF